MTNEALVIEYKNGNAEALNVLIEQNLGMVHQFAHKYSGFCQSSFLEVDDLIQEGMIGLMNAAEKYDPEAEALFSSYAFPAVMGRIHRAANQYIPREKKSDLKSEMLMINSGVVNISSVENERKLSTLSI